MRASPPPIPLHRLATSRLRPRIILLLPEGDPNRSALTRLQAKIESEKISVEILVINGCPDELERRIAEPRPTLFVMCRTAAITAGIRLWIERRFAAESKSAHHLMTISTTLGVGYCWRGISMHYRMMAECHAPSRPNVPPHSCSRRVVEPDSVELVPAATKALPLTEYRLVRSNYGLQSVRDPAS